MREFLVMLVALGACAFLGANLQMHLDDSKIQAAKAETAHVLQLQATDIGACAQKIENANKVSQQSQLTSVKALAQSDRYHKIVTQCLADNGRLVDLVNLCSGKAR